ncbi:class I SAM-dependent DNA methyltransferase [Flavobacterium plurextorum]|uniref:class I SAM-dependent DNA methyltransferase n=1 Tax=Flavobacterium TaxID=237 RepID=UPI00214DB71D|nr:MULTISPECIES: DNA methyltransferase [Flavobacterium]UUW09806.1 class I SAM-dependent DNA methyltransferase [Flavobacterium plurextorum]
MNIAQIESNLQNLITNYTNETFIYEFLLAYGLPKASITRLQKGNLNLSKVEGEISWKKKVFFKPVFNQDLHLAISEIKNMLKQEQRFVIVTDFKTFLAIDTKTNDSLDIDFTALPKHFDFFLPWAGMEKASHKKETEADVKAAEKMAKLFDEIKKDNPDNTPEFIHGLNVFLSRLLFCFFGEDTNIFKLGLFTNSIKSHTQTDGSDLSNYLDKLFEVLNTHSNNRKDLSAYLNEFPYVNGGLFEHKHKMPNFTRRSRQAIIDAGELDWKSINPDIFGSMIQAVVTVEHRGSLGMHYTSVPNIMKVIEPLFLNDLNQEFQTAKYEPKKLNKVLERLGKIKIFDPACGSGNFLIIAYKELRFLEIKILKQLQELQKASTGFEGYQSELELIPKAQLTLAAQYQPTLFSRIELANFFGIELDDFAHEVAILSLWLAQHQMNQKFKEVFGESTPTLPLQAGGNIIHGNATRENWEKICPKKDGDETYILGNPPYLGARLQSDEQKSDMEFVFNKIKGFNNLDYISCWFLKGSNYIQGSNAQYSFVTTNSICQGEQVALLWPFLLKDNLEISFAHTSFKWSNNAKANAGVIVSIIGVRNKNSKIKFIYKDDLKLVVDNINSYLVNAKNTFIEKKSKPISKLPEMCFGSMANDGGNLFLNEQEKENLISKYPDISKLIKKLVGAQEFIRGENKYCLWINDKDLEFANQIPEIANRIEKCQKVRLSSKRGNTNELASKSHQFAEIRFKETNSIIVPSVSSERREYIPMGYLDEKNIIVAPNFAIYNAEPWILTLLTSKIHMSWIKAVCGRLKTDYRYSSSLGYNTFPFPNISQSQKEELEQCVFRILEERENHSEKTLAQMYDPDKMPEALREAHRLNDLAVERCYRSKPFESDEERLEYLFKLYEKMIAEEKEKGTLFQEEKKAKKVRG